MGARIAPLGANTLKPDYGGEKRCQSPQKWKKTANFSGTGNLDVVCQTICMLGVFSKFISHLV